MYDIYCPILSGFHREQKECCGERCGMFNLCNPDKVSPVPPSKNISLEYRGGVGSYGTTPKPNPVPHTKTGGKPLKDEENATSG